MKIAKEQALEALEDLYQIAMRSDNVNDVYEVLHRYIEENQPFVVPDLHDKKIVADHTEECLAWQKEHISHVGWCIGGCAYRLVDE